MIELRNLTKTYRTKGERKWVLRNANIEFPTGRCVALLGRNGAGKSTLLKMIAGTIDCDSGEIIRDGSISWPIGFAGSFHGELTGSQNVRFLARVYGVDTGDLETFTKNFSQLGAFFHMPFRTYSSGMRARLAFGVSMGVQFDTYLIDEVTSVGDANFRAKCDKALIDKMQKSGAIVVSHSLNIVRSLCDCAAVLENGEITFHEDIETGIEHHNTILAGKNPA